MPLLHTIAVGESCHVCGVAIPRNEGALIITDRGERYVCNNDNCRDECSDCYECSGLSHTEDMHETRGGHMICPNCYDNEYFTCSNCGEITGNEELHRNDDNDSLCDSCYDDSTDEEVRYREPDLRSVEFQSEDKGELIKSTRRFGIELECVYPEISDAVNFTREMPDKWGVESDGSVSGDDDYADGMEIVSPILQGKKGENGVRRVCELAKKFGLAVNHTCGFHLHLNLPEFVRDKRSDKKQKDDSKQPFTLIYKRRDNGEEYAEQPTDGYNGRHIPCDIITRPTDYFITRNYGVAFNKIKNLLTFYVCFDDVFRAMMPKSRRNNHYCQSLKKAFALEEIIKCDDYVALESIWYRERDEDDVEHIKSGSKYHDSRYCGLNLHIFFSKKKTAELRYHTPTLNADKILLWIATHQTIVDYVAECGLDYDELIKIDSEVLSPAKKAKLMCEMVDMPAYAEAHILARIKKFAGEAEDTEVKGEADN